MRPSFRRVAETLLFRTTPAAEKPWAPDLLAPSDCHPPITRPREPTIKNAVSSSVVIATPTPYAPSAATLPSICAATRARRAKPRHVRPVTRRSEEHTSELHSRDCNASRVPPDRHI